MSKIFKYLDQLGFKDRVLFIVKAIPSGETMSYKEVAEKAGNPLAHRAVGNIMKANHNPDIPCHRVIRKNGTPGGYNGGRQKKIEMLKKEKAL